MHTICGTSNGRSGSSVQLASMVADAAGYRKYQERLIQLGVHTSSRTCTAVLNILSDSKPSVHVRRIYKLIVETTDNSVKCFDSLLVASCIEENCLHEACILATKLPELNVLVWNCLIGSYARQQLCKEAFHAFALMQRKGVKADTVTYVNILSACIDPHYFEMGKCLHHTIIFMDCEVDVILGTALLTMYNKCGGFEEVSRLFDFIEVHNVVSWTVMIRAYVKEHDFAKAFYLYDQMRQEGTLPNRVTFLSLLEAYSYQEALPTGKHLHSCIVPSPESDLHIAAALVHMYGECGSFEDARDLFNLLPMADVVTWNAMITAFIRQEQYDEVLHSFFSMMDKGIVPSLVTYITVLPACIYGHNHIVKEVHARIISNGYQDDIAVMTGIMNAYGRLGRLDTAVHLFDNLKEQNVVAWNTMIALHAENHDMENVLLYLDKMQTQGLWKTNATYLSALDALSNDVALPAGKRLHCLIIGNGYKTDVTVMTAVLNMYCRCGDISQGLKTFNSMPIKNLISWNTILSACDHYMYAIQGFDLFKQMHSGGFIPDKATFTSMLSICANQLVLLTLGRALHDHVIQSGFHHKIFVISLLDMYGKCGSLEDAQESFSKMSKESIVAWNAMLSIYAQHGCIKEAIEMVDLMWQEGIGPNNVTFLSLLFAYSHTGMLTEACNSLLYMNMLSRKLSPEQIRCFLDLLMRAGQLEQAMEVLNNMPFDPSAIGWSISLSASRHTVNSKLASQIVEHILEHDPCSSAASIFLRIIDD
ncbi:hypothetical protein KP509_38G042900 [Ceratopteris richardii]|nr:hypothetical protein KP509_38G042900 [Ceratopteris richardii]